MSPSRRALPTSSFGEMGAGSSSLDTQAGSENNSLEYNLQVADVPKTQAKACTLICLSQNNSASASLTDFTPTICTPSSRSSPDLFEAGITIFLKPSACASRARTAACVVPRTSPVNPTSPNTVVCGSIGMILKLDVIAA